MTSHDGAWLRRLHRELLAPTFPDDELHEEAVFVQRVMDGELLLAAREDGAGPVAVAVAEHFREERVLLLVWLAVRSDARGGGLGRALLQESLARWQQELDPVLVLGEVEHPELAPEDEGFGDPRRRLQFYASFGVRALPVAHVQPPYREGGASVESLMLSVFRCHGEPPGGRVPSAPVRGFLRAYLARHPELLPAVLGDLAGDELATVPLTAPIHELPRPPALVRPTPE